MNKLPHTKTMKVISVILIMLLFGCSTEQDSFPVLIGSQFSSCDHLINLNKEKVQNLKTPSNFKITPAVALQIVKENTNFKCLHKMGAQIYADHRFYYFVRIGTGKSLNFSQGLTSIKVIVSGIDGSFWEMKYGGIAK